MSVPGISNNEGSDLFNIMQTYLSVSCQKLRCSMMSPSHSQLFNVENNFPHASEAATHHTRMRVPQYLFETVLTCMFGCVSCKGLASWLWVWPARLCSEGWSIFKNSLSYWTTATVLYHHEPVLGRGRASEHSFHVRS